MAATVSLLLLAATLWAAIRSPHGFAQASVAAAAAVVVVATGLLDAEDAAEEIADLAGTVAFLAAILVLAHLCAEQGVFRYAGAVMARSARRRPVPLLGWTLAIGAATTTTLSLDATVVLFTPVVLATAAASRLRARPHLFATVHVANSASLLLPVSNLTNLLAFDASGLSFARFALLMTLPTLAVLVVEYAVLRWYFRADLRRGSQDARLPEDAPVPVPWPALAVVAATLAGLAFSASLDLAPAAVAAVGAVALAALTLVRPPAGSPARTDTAWATVRAIDPMFAVFVLGLGVTVRAVEENGLGEVIESLIPERYGLLGLLAIAAVAALLANTVNNLPATLLLLPAVAGAGPGPVLAVLIGVNVGPNLSYPGSLATLLWRRVLIRAGAPPAFRDFAGLGLVSVPAVIVAAVGGLWLALRLGW